MTDDVTRILGNIESGESLAPSELLPLVYDELRRLAASQMAMESPDQTLQATALVHEAYLRLVDQRQTQHWDNRRHFFAAAAEAMRRILIERARARNALKRGGDRKRVEFEPGEIEAAAPAVDLLALDEALSMLSQKDPELAELVKLRYFAGLSVEQAARALRVSPRTVKRRWSLGRAWLLRRLNDGQD